MARRYQMRRRAERQEQTRQRVVEATVALHATVGPVRTTVSAIAERAGVQRHTVYRHFPDDLSLFQACGSHFVTKNPPPDTARWLEIRDPEARLRTALGEAYRYYERHEGMMANIVRDSEFVAVGAGFREGHARMTEAVLSGWSAMGTRKRMLEASVSLALDFRTWQHLVRTRALAPSQAVEVAAGGVLCLASAHA
jgi:AcrR family transcriptional regulator